MKIIVIGAGIGGLFAGIALRDAGFDVIVYERCPEPQPGGAGLTLWANALKLFRHYGMLDDILAHAGTFEHSEFRTAAGRTLVRVALADLVEQFGLPTVCVGRNVVSDVLLDRFGHENVVWATEMVRAEQDGDTVYAEFSDGQRISADVLIGADGIHSAVRPSVCPGSAPQYDGQTVWRGVTDVDSLPATAFVSFGRGSRAGWSPMGDGRVYWFGARFQPPGTPDRFGSMKADALAEFGDWGDPLGRIISATPEDAISRTDIYAVPRLPTWSSGRIALLGDAAHAMAPHIAQGACLAVEDATVLALRLADGPTPEEALRRYSDERQPRAEELRDEADRIGRPAAMRGPVSSRLRNAVLALTPGRMLLAGFAKPAAFEIV
ncbi:2-polyprenyl-6-methoxyphenol hydroxylase [Mycolicibacterium rutilum]|uniref:2-polyprenyl-6-methoxyphenol hydroxylase n=1 Tax=Mycolicibacterium rutilum TaxID=370526 RepID=A0A1H6JF18_MYCRU|nr:FAD-dependent monooxygenase [Mycolicibacterium rutilum]SEH57664.1 2-polyprenyl-6-methoxyphenol hydroxylase [Mycolicibacterium rutilum]